MKTFVIPFLTLLLVLIVTIIRSILYDPLKTLVNNLIGLGVLVYEIPTGFKILSCLTTRDFSFIPKLNLIALQVLINLDSSGNFIGHKLNNWDEFMQLVWKEWLGRQGNLPETNNSKS